MRLTSLSVATVLAATTLAAAPSPVAAGEYSTYAIHGGISVLPKRIYVRAYEKEDTVELLPNMVTATASFQQDYELYEGDTLTFRFGFVFDPDNTTLATLVDSVANQTAVLTGTGGLAWQTATVQSSITLPSTMKSFKSWCAAAGTTYTIDSVLWAQLPNVYDTNAGGSAMIVNQPVEWIVDCKAKKPTLAKFNVKNLAVKLFAPKLKITAIKPITK